MTTAVLEGKSKIIRDGDAPGEIRVVFKDVATAFNGEKFAEIPGKGPLNATISALLFEKLQAASLPTCFVRRGATEAELVYRRLRMIPLEIVVRNAAYGSICKRFGFEPGHRFPTPIIEFFLKDDATGDPQITDDVIQALGLLPDGVTLDAIRHLALKANEVFVALFARRGIGCADFKLEFGLDDAGILTVGDELSPDNFRLRDVATGEVLDKDVFRLDLADLPITYRRLLQRLQEAPTGDAKTTPQTFLATVVVRSRKNILNPESKAILESLHALGYPEVEALSAGRHFALTLTASSLAEAEERVHALAESLLANTVIEDYTVTLSLQGARP